MIKGSIHQENITMCVLLIKELQNTSKYIQRKSDRTKDRNR